MGSEHKPSGPTVSRELFAINNIADQILFAFFEIMAKPLKKTVKRCQPGLKPND